MFVKSIVGEFELPRAIVEMWRFCTKDKQRANLQGVCFEPEISSQSLVNVIATNGHILAHYVWPNPDLRAALGDNSVLVPATALKHATGKRKPYLSGSRLVMRKMSPVGEVLEEIAVSDCFREPEGGKWIPNWRAVIPSKPATPCVSMALNPAYLKLLSEYALRLKRHGILARVPGGDMDPVRWRLELPEGGDVTIVQMPVRAADAELEAA